VGSDAAGEVGSRFQGLRATCLTCALSCVDVHSRIECFICRVDGAIHLPDDTEGEEVP
jgi:hypothetical protein